MQSYHNSAELKEKIINQLQMHYDLDQIIQGTYWENGKGCALGCIMHQNGTEDEGIHISMQKELGIIQPIPRLIDRIFEGLDNEMAKEFPLKVMKAIPVGNDLSQVWSKFAVWLLIDDEHGVIRHAKTDGAKNAIKNVTNLYERKLKCDPIKNQEWREASRDTYAAVAYAGAAYDAASYVGANAADAYAADAYAAAAAHASYAAAAAADAYAAGEKKNHYKIMADKLIELVS